VRIAEDVGLIRRRPRLTERFMVRMTAEDLERLRAYAEAQARPVAHAALYLIRLGLRPGGAEPDIVALTDEVPRADLLSELGLHNLIATEQVIQLMQSVVRDGAAAADRVLPAAARAAQTRLARGETIAAEPPQ
jgi:hypothetical protein